MDKLSLAFQTYAFRTKNAWCEHLLCHYRLPEVIRRSDKMSARSRLREQAAAPKNTVHISDDEVRDELRRQGYGEPPYAVVQQFKRDLERRVRDEVNKRIAVNNTSTPLVSHDHQANAQTGGFSGSDHMDSSSKLQDATYSSCYSTPYNESLSSNTRQPNKASAPEQPPRKTAPRNRVKFELSSSCYSTPASSSSSDRETTGNQSTDDSAPRILHRKILRCVDGNAYISERSTLSGDSHDGTVGAFESFKENSTRPDYSLRQKSKSATLPPPLPGVPIQKDVVIPERTSMLSLLRASGAKVAWSKGGKCDPVARYHEYRAFWDRHKAPGEKAHKQLRWNVRAQMLRRDDPVTGSWRPVVGKGPPAPPPKPK